MSRARAWGCGGGGDCRSKGLSGDVPESILPGGKAEGQRHARLQPAPACSFGKEKKKLGVSAHACKTCTQVAEAEGWPQVFEASLGSRAEMGGAKEHSGIS